MAELFVALVALDRISQFHEIARIVVAPEVARCTDDLATRLYHSAPEGALHGIVSALAGRLLAPRAEETFDGPMLRDASRGMSDGSQTFEEIAARAGDAEVGRTKTDAINAAQAWSGTSLSGRAGTYPVEAVAIASASGEAASGEGSASEAAPAEPPRRGGSAAGATTRPDVVTVASADAVFAPSPALPAAPEAPRRRGAAAGDHGPRRHGAPANSGKRSVEAPVREEGLPDPPPIFAFDVNDLALDREIRNAGIGALGEEGGPGEEGEPGEEQDYRDGTGRNETPGELQNEGSNVDAQQAGEREEEEEETPSAFRF